MVNGEPKRKHNGPYPKPIKERILAAVHVDSNGCWHWTKYVKPNGYGQVGVPGRYPQYVHRVAYEAWVGPIPDGLHLDHLCRQRDCCNPRHLQPVTAAVNVRRAFELITHCPQGHPYDESNTYRHATKPGRQCRACRNAHSQRSTAKAAARVAGVPVSQRIPSPRAVKTHCPQGHPMSGTNLYVDTRGTRCCRECRRQATNRSHSRRRQNVLS
jgi:hypothetical protein